MHAKITRVAINVALIGAMLLAVALPFLAPDSVIARPVRGLPAGFVHAKAGEPRLIVGPSETPILLTGVNFPAVGWYDVESESIDNVLNAKDFRQEDYYRVAAMGMNVIRLPVWYKLFQESNGTYNQATGSAPGWAWLDNQIQMAKNAGVYIGLSLMRVEPNGYADTAFFGSTTAKNNMKSLWEQFATRYRNETQIAYYDLLNEPTPSSPSQWHAYAQTLVNAIRAIDPNHLLNLQHDLNLSTPFLVTDPQNNVMYDVHFYEPYYYTSFFMRRGWQGQYQTISSNPWPIEPWDITWGTATGSLLPSSPTGTFGWTQYETALFTPPSAEHIMAQIVFVAPSGGTMFFDDFQFIEVAPGGSEMLLETLDLEDAASYHPADAPYKVYRSDLTRISGSGNPTASTAGPHSGAASIRFPANSKFTSVRLSSPVRQGYSYKIRGWLKGSSVTGSGGFGVRWGDWPYGTFEPLTKATLETNMFDPNGSYNYSYYISRNIPVNAGEWGLSPYAFAEKPGYYVSANGLAYVRDVLGLFQQYNINSAYWVYSRFNNYYIYRNCPPFTTTCEWPSPTNANQPLIDLFTEILAGEPLLTDTPEPSPTPTNTVAPPTLTNTPHPPTSTSTPTATNTPVPPTATNTPLPSQRIFLDDFETSFSGWTTSGTVTWYAGDPKNGTRSIRFSSNDAWMNKTISTVGYRNIVVRVYMGAESFEGSEAFKLFWRNGSTWVSLKAITNGSPEEDGQLHYLEFALPSSADNKSTFGLAFNLQSSDTADYGYVDDIEVWGTP